MTQIENFVKLILADFLVFLEAQEKDKYIEKELDINKNPSIHNNEVNQEGV